MSYIVDRRLNSKNKSAVNRQRFLRRYRKQIQKAVSDAVSERGITDMERGEKIVIPKDDTSEPFFHHGSGGQRDYVHPGNKEFVGGDQIRRPESSGGGGSGQGQASNAGEGIDEFVFQISQKEFLEFLFEDLALPNLLKRQLLDDDSFKLKRAGYSDVGSPNQLNIVRSLRSAHARRIALGGKKRKRRQAIRQTLDELKEPLTEEERSRKYMLEEELKQLGRQLNAIPFIDDFDLKYNLTVKVPQPSPKAVMFCVMDVSGSMTQDIKDTAKRFFFLLYLFLKRQYEKTEVVFIRHHTSAVEVDEETFFYSRETGGTVVSSALRLMHDIIEERYPPNQWNIYGAQASDGDNWQGDIDKCHEIMSTQLLPLVQYFTYIEIGGRDVQSLWRLYEAIQSDFNDVFAISQVYDNNDIYPVFRQLFQRQTSGRSIEGEGR